MNQMFCMGCQGYFSRVEWHHVGGRAHHDRLVPLCVTCHRSVTTEQQRAGLRLSSSAISKGEERACAISVGWDILLKLVMTNGYGNKIQDLSSVSSGLAPQPLYGES